jgi:hypothetical protein
VEWEYFGSYEALPTPDPAGWVDGAPTLSTDHSCAICGRGDVVWVHPLDAAKVRYRAWGKGHTLPTFWALCDGCEDLYRVGDDETLVARMGEGREPFIDVGEEARIPLAVFRSADRGGRRFADRADA